MVPSGVEDLFETLILFYSEPILCDFAAHLKSIAEPITLATHKRSRGRRPSPLTSLSAPRWLAPPVLFGHEDPSIHIDCFLSIEFSPKCLNQSTHHQHNHSHCTLTLCTVPQCTLITYFPNLLSNKSNLHITLFLIWSFFLIK